MQQYQPEGFHQGRLGFIASSRLSSLEISILAASGVFAVAAMITGRLTSLAKPIRVAAITPKITPYMTFLATAAILYFLLNHPG